MQRYESKQQQIRRPAEEIYAIVSRFDHLTPALQDKVDQWRADADTCSFNAKGFTVSLAVTERQPPKSVKVQSGEGGLPIDFTFWIQLQPVAENDTRLRLVLEADLNVMMRMMIGGKLQQGLDQVAEGIAKAMNN